MRGLTGCVLNVVASVLLLLSFFWWMLSAHAVLTVCDGLTYAPFLLVFLPGGNFILMLILSSGSARGGRPGGCSNRMLAFAVGAQVAAGAVIVVMRLLSEAPNCD